MLSTGAVIKYIFKNAAGYYKYCRKIPNSQKQFVFSLKTKNIKLAKKIVSSFQIKSNSYFLYLKNLSKEEILIRSNEIIEALDAYKNEAMVEDSSFEMSRHIHFTHNKLDGSYLESILYWRDELIKYNSRGKTPKQTDEFVKKILSRSTIALKEFYKTITNEEKWFFRERLFKTEAALLKMDKRRFNKHFIDDEDEDIPTDKFSKEIVKEIVKEAVTEVVKGLGTTGIVKKNKYEVLEEYLSLYDVTKRFKKEKHLFEGPLKILIQASDKEFLSDYTRDDYRKFLHTFIWFPGNVTKKTRVINKLNDNYHLISMYFKKIYLDNLDIDLDDTVAPLIDIDDDNFENEFLNDEEFVSDILTLDVQSVTSLKTKISTVSKFIDYCSKNKYIETTMFDNEKNYINDCINQRGNDTKIRTKFDLNEISYMFKLFIQYKFFIDENIAYFYIPMIAMFSGLRVEEICKLRKSDIINKNGVICFDINGNVKTIDSIRKVPIHPFLLNNLHFLKYVENRKDMLFDLQMVTIYNKPKYSRKYIAVFSNFRTEFVSEKRIKEELISFHSFRHFTASSLKAGGVSKDDIATILGHKYSSGETGTYIDHDPRTLNGYIKKLDVKDLKNDLQLLSATFSDFIKTNNVFSI